MTDPLEDESEVQKPPASPKPAPAPTPTQVNERLDKHLSRDHKDDLHTMAMAIKGSQEPPPPDWTRALLLLAFYIIAVLAGTMILQSVAPALGILFLAIMLILGPFLLVVDYTNKAHFARYLIDVQQRKNDPGSHS